MIDRKQLWKWATFAAVIVIAANPEMIGMALFIDAVGLELFILLLQVQLIAYLGMIFPKAVRSRVSKWYLLTYSAIKNTILVAVCTTHLTGLFLVVLVSAELFRTGLMTLSN